MLPHKQYLNRGASLRPRDGGPPQVLTLPSTWLFPGRGDPEFIKNLRAQHGNSDRGRQNQISRPNRQERVVGPAVFFMILCDPTVLWWRHPLRFSAAKTRRALVEGQELMRQSQTPRWTELRLRQGP